jgi:predicted ribosome quality control (RQC) complex YloA/Tae2 family protein
MKTLANIGPFTAAEVMARCETSNPEEAACQLHSLIARLRAGKASPTLLLDEQGRPADAWAFNSEIHPSERQEIAPSMSLALEVSARFRRQSVDRERLRGATQTRLQAEIEREEKRISELEAGREHAEKADDYRIMGELIQSNVSTIQKGQERVEVQNYYVPNVALLKIELDVKLSPQENAEAYFRRHRKARSSLPLIEERIAEAERRRERWKERLKETEEAEEGRLKAILGMLEKATPPERSTQTQTLDAVKRPAPGVRRTVSSDGYEIWYGEHKEGNDTLTSKLAAPSDIWLHVRAGTSAHVVIRARKQPETVPRRTLMEAAKIAVAHSDSKHSGMTPVDYTLKKYVRKPRGSGPGKALYTHEKTLHIGEGD